MQNVRPPDLLNQNLHFIRIFGLSDYLLIFEKHKSKKMYKTQGLQDPVLDSTDANSPVTMGQFLTIFLHWLPSSP